MRKLLNWVLMGGAIVLASCSAIPQASEPNAQAPVAASSDSNATASTAVATNATDASGTAGPEYFQEKGIAIRGADPVAYFTDSAYVPGSAEFTHDWQGATWQFASAEHRDSFAANPEAYAPQYGGFCAWAVSQGYTAEVDPEAWKVVDGKLYLNFDKKIQKRWEKDIPGFIAAANQNWPGVLK
jgi:YHS domain-containing protein